MDFLTLKLLTPLLMNLLDLPEDVLLLVFHSLALRDFGHLFLACKYLNTLITAHGWDIYRRQHPHPTFSLAKLPWSSYTRIRYEAQSDKAWKQPNATFIARPLLRPWNGKFQPVMDIGVSNLLVCAGDTILRYLFGENKPSITLHSTQTLSTPDLRFGDATAVAILHEEPELVVLISSQDGFIVRLDFSEDDVVRTIVCRGRTGQRLVVQQNVAVSLSQDGALRLLGDIDSAEMSLLSSFELGRKSWTAFLNLNHSPFIALGTTSTTAPLSVHSLSEDSVQLSPSAIMSVGNSDAEASKSAVYGISKAPLNAPWGSSPEIIISGWYDGQVRVHDLRSSLRDNKAEGSSSLAPLKPVMCMADPWSFEPIYSVASGGGSSCHVGAGSARHGIVSFWDIRSPGKGWSVHAPGNDPSPVYSLLMESSRVFGATQSRPFVLDFGSHHINHDSYPPLPENKYADRLKGRVKRFGYYVTQYSHELPYSV